jgi:hypothetical protein
MIDTGRRGDFKRKNQVILASAALLSAILCRFWPSLSPIALFVLTAASQGVCPVMTRETASDPFVRSAFCAFTPGLGRPSSLL